jgi:hypothetical protein
MLVSAPGVRNPSTGFSSNSRRHCGNFEYKIVQHEQTHNHRTFFHSVFGCVSTSLVSKSLRFARNFPGQRAFTLG